MTELIRSKPKIRASNAHKLMALLYAGSILASTVAVFAGVGVLAGIVSFEAVIGFLPPVIGTVLLAFIPATLIAFLAPGN